MCLAPTKLISSVNDHFVYISPYDLKASVPSEAMPWMQEDSAKYRQRSRLHRCLFRGVHASEISTHRNLMCEDFPHDHTKGEQIGPGIAWLSH